jgi:transposase-like protein
MTALTIRHELAFDPVTQDLIRDLLRAITRGAAPVAEPEPASPPADPGLADPAPADPGPGADDALPALPVIANRLGALTDEDRAILLAHREAGAHPSALARQLGVRASTISGILYTARLKRDRGADGKLHKGKGFWTPERRAELVRRYEAGETREALAKHYAATPDAVRLQIWKARKQRAAPQPAPAELTPAEPSAPEIRLKEFVTELEPPPPPPAPPPPAKPENQQTYLTVKQAVALAAGKPAAPALPAAPRPPAAPPRQIRQDLAAAMAAFEAAKGVIRIPTAREFAAIGVPMSFPDEAAAIEWLTSHGHDVRKGPGQSVITLDGKRVARPSFPQRAAGIAREYGMKLIAERQNQGRAA